MLKFKIVFLYVDSKGNCEWSHQWVDGEDSDELLDDVILIQQKKEKEEIRRGYYDLKLQHVLIAETCVCDDGEYYCRHCCSYFDELKDGCCYYCGSGSWESGKEEQPDPDSVDNDDFDDDDDDNDDEPYQD